MQRCHSNDEVEKEVSELNRAHDGMQMTLLALDFMNKMKMAVNPNLQLYEKVFSQNAFAMSDHRILNIHGSEPEPLSEHP